MDLTKALDEISEKEREKAQLELLEKQFKEERAGLLKKMKEAGVKDAADLKNKIEELEKLVADNLQALREGRPIEKPKAKKAPAKEKKANSESVEVSEETEDAGDVGDDFDGSLDDGVMEMDD